MKYRRNWWANSKVQQWGNCDQSPCKRWKVMTRLASGFSIEFELGLDRTQYVPSCSRATFRKDYVCQHSAVHSSKRSKNTVCKAKLSVRIKPITANSRAKDKYVKVCMITLTFVAMCRYYRVNSNNQCKITVRSSLLLYFQAK